MSTRESTTSHAHRTAPRKGSAPKRARPAAELRWERRLRSREFHGALRELVAGQIDTVARRPIKDLLDPGLVRSFLERRGPRFLKRADLADLAEHVAGRVMEELKARNKSLLGLLDRELSATIDSILDEELVLSRGMEEFVATLMQQEFIKRLFTDIIYTSIVSFNERVNPIFGRLAMGMMEDQIKNFIGLFLPLVLKQATAFAVSRNNQAILFSFTRSIVRQVLSEPIPGFFALASPGMRRKLQRLLRQALSDERIDTLTGELSLAIWEDVYARIKNRRLGDLVDLDAHGDWLAERLLEALLPALAAPEVVRFVAAEFALLGGPDH